jgi:hypothetical protein
MQPKWIAALVIGITMLSGVAHAKDDATRQCLIDARTEAKTCTQVCRDDFQAAVDTCRGRNHDCAEEARDAHQTCVSDTLHALGQCLTDSCSSVFHDLVEGCKEQFPAGSHERDVCIDGAQMQNFQCRDQCRESVELFKSLKTCRDEFKADLKACVPPVVMAP